MSTATATRVFNFSAGPAVLPVPVLKQIENEMLALPGVGSSVLEISHRCAAFDEILASAERRIASLVGLPSTHRVLFLQGGSALQNVMIPANLLTSSDQTADYIVTGSWGKKSAAEVHHYGKLNVVWDGKQTAFSRVPTAEEMQFSDNAAYCHFTSNETIQGVQFKSLPATNAPLVVDKSSDMFSEPIDVSKYGLIYACAQKNLGIAGVTILIIDEALLERSDERLPSYLNYSLHATNGSRFNTPPTFAIYVTDLVCKWIEEEMGGLMGVAKFNSEKAAVLYDVIDNSGGFYCGHADVDDRSTMNVVFMLETPELEQKFLAEATQLNLTTLKGHRSLGGIRASIYNAMPREGVDALAKFMTDFAQTNG